MEPILVQLTECNDRWTEAGWKRQIMDAASKYNGGVVDEASGIARPHHLGTPVVMASWAASLVQPQSRYYRDAKLLQAFGLASQFMLNRQHSDGTISLGATNFHSPPDTAFVVTGLAQVYQLLKREAWPEAEPALLNVRLFLERTIPAMLTGGCHTPNHRWVLTAALAMLYELFERPELKQRAQAWLAEGIDITEEGEWTERSNGIYNAVSDISLYHTARVFGQPELLEPVRRNLRMMIYMIHPNGDVVTEYSGRQDLGQTFDLSNYFLICRLMAEHDRDPLMAAMSDAAGEALDKFREGVNNHPAVGTLLYSRGLQDLPRTPLPNCYVKPIHLDYPMQKYVDRLESAGHHGQVRYSRLHLHFGAPLVRIRELDDSMTVMSQAPSFFSLRHGQARLLGIKLASSFAPGTIVFDRLTASEELDQFKLEKIEEKGYNGPIPSSLLTGAGSAASSLRAGLRASSSISLDASFESASNPSSGSVAAGLWASSAAAAGLASVSLEPSPWYLLPHQHRPITHLQRHALSAELSRSRDEWKLRVVSGEQEDVLTQLTFVLGVEGRLEGDGLERISEWRYLLKSGSFRYRCGDDAIEFSSGCCEHKVSDIWEDVHPPGCIYVHVNLLTPMDRTFTLRLL
ncbi:hypothetical protein [Paenibacillus rigui]|uniref:Heparinase n=1 Tax=Paenibacillus rigui TaxID=554312 RepID=A0A229UJP4_9BACL|nr:hypothetical protein [Paenibacillus rigui]OXM83613.1 hypothetical protein CF651_24615 [Paenibacillus rigui]